MWVRKNPADAERSKKISRKKRWLASIAIGVGAAVLATFVNGSFAAARLGTFFVQEDHISRQLPVSLLLGVFVTLWFYWLVFDKKTVICHKCGHVKTQDNVTKCSCGGSYADLDEYRWDE
jgi:hypothetical protein